MRSPTVNKQRDSAQLDDDYLWMKQGEPDPDILRLERLLSPCAFRATASRTSFAQAHTAARARVRARWIPRALTAAAAIALIVGVGWLYVRLQWPIARAWSVEPAFGTSTIDNKPLNGRGLLSQGGVLRTAENSAVRINVARIGRVVVWQDSQIELVETRSGHHRLRLDHGRLSARLWAPPFSFGVQTPLANALDIGCEFTLSIAPTGSGLLQVTHGWVELEKDGFQLLIPEGAQAELDSTLGPGTPFDDHATAAFRSALKAIDALGRELPADDPAIEQLTAASRAQDAITLISLLKRYPNLADTVIYDRAVALLPPPDGLTRDTLRNKNQQLLDAWWRKLPYSQVKTWWMRWPDILEFTR
jgi:hypothetical protein